VSELVANLNWWDLVDVGFVAIVIYALLKLIRGTRAVSVVMGILVLAGISYLAKATGLLTLEKLLQNFVVVIPFAVIVIFQDQIRRALATFGDTSILGLGGRQNLESTISEIGRAAAELIKRRIGALLVFEGRQGLRDYADRGVRLDAEVSRDLLINIFTPGAPLHDGAVILRGSRIAAAACILPLSRQMGIDADLGTRHRAALGISDQSDALAVVVSEETGEISVAHQGVFTRGIDSGQLLTLLHEHLTRSQDSSSPPPPAVTEETS